jgi:hypothetical protein
MWAPDPGKATKSVASAASAGGGLAVTPAVSGKHYPSAKS